MADPSRNALLARIREQLSAHGTASKTDAVTDYSAIKRNYRRAGNHTAEENIVMFMDRLEDYDAHVVRTPEIGVSAAIGELLATAGHTQVLVPAAYPQPWLPAGVSILRDRNTAGDEMMSHAELDQIHAVLTTCAVAIATTGTLLLQHTAEEGRRAITLVPDFYACVVRASQIVETVPEGFARIDSPRLYPITTVSGPSATSDIEMTRIRGVHGPRHLGIVIVDGI